MIARILQRFIGQAGAPSEDARWQHLYPSNTFHELLQRERAGVDRQGGDLSLITFAPRDWQAGGQTLAALAQAFRKRLRLADFAGWLDANRLAVVLPQTGAAGAWKVADDILLNLAGDQSLPVVRVYTYPSQWWTGDEEQFNTPQETGGQAVHAAESLWLQPMPNWKRSIDVLGACVGFVVLSPVMLAVAAVMKVSSPGPVFFKQWRSGRGGKPFQMIKFRSMVVDAEARKQDLMQLNEQDGPAFKITDDPRVTRLGHFLRSTSLDELPQLWNVLRGQMSLVGPRPLPVHESNACSTWQRARLEVTPGITCFWQAQGGQRVSFAEWMRMDLRYVRARSLACDLGLIFKTVFAVISRKALKHG